MLPGMERRDHYHGNGDRPGELPELPIPRPGEPTAARPSESREPRISRPALGASFTAASEGQPVPPQDELEETPPHDLQLMTWEMAARLTSGMLANPTRTNSSVKDAMALFDQFLHEMHTYVQIVRENAEHAETKSYRRTYSDYFRGTQPLDAEPGASSPSSQPLPAGPLSPATPPTPPKPAPSKPRPAGDYRPIPPGMRGPFSPGSVPPPDSDGDESTRAA
jgi:hypothetical protein